MKKLFSSFLIAFAFTFTSAQTQCLNLTNVKVNQAYSSTLRYATITFDKPAVTSQYTVYDLLFAPTVFMKDNSFDYLYSHQDCGAHIASSGGYNSPSITISAWWLIPGAEYQFYIMASDKQTGANFCYSPMYTFTALGANIFGCTTQGCAATCYDAITAPPQSKTTSPTPTKKK